MTEDNNYRKAVVTFVDILGFRELVSTKTSTEIRTIIRHVQSFGKNVDTVLDREEDKRKFNWTSALAFSDTIIRVRPFDSLYNDGSLFHEIIALVHMQGELANLGVFVRGGTTVGNVYFDKDAIFGPAFVRAYDLESQFANVPRIVIGPEVFAELRSNNKLRAEHHNLADEIHYLKRLLARSDDGLWFVDYLSAMQREIDYPESYLDLLKKHRNFIMQYGRLHTLQSRPLQKYLWLANYHNSVVTKMSRGDPPKDLIITSDDISALEMMPEISTDIHEDD